MKAFTPTCRQGRRASETGRPRGRAAESRRQLAPRCAKMNLLSPFEALLVKSWELLGRTRTPDGDEMTLTRRGGEYVILAGGKSLMSSRMHGSEEALATFTCRRVRTLERPCVLVGGLGMGFTLRATLDLLPPGATVVVAELVPAVVEWNRGPLGSLAGQPLKDRRVKVHVGDVATILSSGPGRFDAVLLDVDNGPEALTAALHVGRYNHSGLAAIRAALQIGEVSAVWSARADRE